MKDWIDVIDDIVQVIPLDMKANDIVGNRIYLCNTMHITKDKIVEDENGSQYTVTDISHNDWIEVTPNFIGTIVTAPKVTYLFGTPTSVNNEYQTLSNNSADKTPFIWLVETFEEVLKSEEDALERSVRNQIFFLDWSREDEWLNKEHHKFVIKPMMNLSDSFIKVIKQLPEYKGLEEFTRRYRPRFGVEVSNKGSVKKIIDEKLSGVELKINIEKFKPDCIC